MSLTDEYNAKQKGAEVSRIERADFARKQVEEGQALLSQIEQEALWTSGNINQRAVGIVQAVGERDINKARHLVRQLANIMEKPSLILEKDRTSAETLSGLPPTAINMPDAFKFPISIKMRRGYFVVIGAKPKTGKTTTACNWVYYNTKMGYKTLFLTAELPPADIWTRFYQVSQAHRGRRHDFNEWDVILSRPEERDSQRKFARGCEREGWLKIHDVRGYSVDDICFLIDDGDADVVIFDYLQRIAPAGRVSSMREHFLDASRRLAHKMTSANAVGLFFSQLNKEGSFKETGGFEEDSQMNILLDRPLDPVDETPMNLMTITIKSSRYTAPAESTVAYLPRWGILG